MHEIVGPEKDDVVAPFRRRANEPIVAVVCGAERKLDGEIHIEGYVANGRAELHRKIDGR